MIRNIGAPRQEPAAPESQSPEGICQFCRARITKVKGNFIAEYWIAIEPQRGVALPIECGARPRPGMGPGSFDRHVPR